MTTSNFIITPQEGDKISKSYLVQPSDGKIYPGILMFHEFWGLTENIKEKARNLSEEGYVVLAPDLYGKGWTADTAEAAASAMQKLVSDMESTLKKLNHFLMKLKSLEFIYKDKIAVMGYCMGGTLSLDMARTGSDIQGALSFHGGLERKSSLPPIKPIKAKILILNGEADIFVPEEHIQKFKEEMGKAGADYRLVNYPEALHGFTNPQATENGKKFNMPLAYDEEADQASWREMTQFLKELF